MQIGVPSRARNSLSIRLSGSEKRLLTDAAARGPEHLTAFIRRTALAAARKALSANGSDGRKPELLTR